LIDTQIVQRSKGHEPTSSTARASIPAAES
jgi:hypothetical protein